MNIGRKSKCFKFSYRVIIILNIVEKCIAGLYSTASAGYKSESMLTDNRKRSYLFCFIAVFAAPLV